MFISPHLITRDELFALTKYDLMRIIDGHAIPTDEIVNGERIYVHFSYEVVPSVMRATMRVFNSIWDGAE